MISAMLDGVLHGSDFCTSRSARATRWRRTPLHVKLTLGSRVARFVRVRVAQTRLATGLMCSELRREIHG
jgi:hypothetical protein